MERAVRPTSIKKWKDSSKSKAARESMSIDCARLWNLAPEEIRNAETKSVAKQTIKRFSRTLEI